MYLFSEKEDKKKNGFRYSSVTYTNTKYKAPIALNPIRMDIERELENNYVSICFLELLAVNIYVQP